MLSEYTLKVSAQELQVLVGCMHEAPYKLVAPLLNKLQAQIHQQELAAQEQSSGGARGSPTEGGETAA